MVYLNLMETVDMARYHKFLRLDEFNIFKD